MSVLTPEVPTLIALICSRRASITFTATKSTAISTIRSAYIIFIAHFKMNVVQPKQYVKETMRSTIVLPRPEEQGNIYPFQWLIFKPQAHAVEPFAINEATRNGNVERR